MAFLDSGLPDWTYEGIAGHDISVDTSVFRSAPSSWRLDVYPVPDSAPETQFDIITPFATYEPETTISAWVRCAKESATGTFAVTLGIFDPLSPTPAAKELVMVSGAPVGDFVLAEAVIPTSFENAYDFSEIFVSGRQWRVKIGVYFDNWDPSTTTINVDDPVGIAETAEGAGGEPEAPSERPLETVVPVPVAGPGALVGDVTHALGRWFIFHDTEIKSTTDFTTWVTRSFGATSPMFAQSSTKLVVYRDGYGAPIQTTDGVNWEVFGGVGSNTYFSYAGGMWFAYGAAGEMYYSTDDAVSWQASTLPTVRPQTTVPLGVAYSENQGRFYFIQNDPTFNQHTMYSSTDGVVWVEDAFTSGRWESLHTVGEHAVGLLSSGELRVMGSSTQGVVPEGLLENRGRDIVYDGSEYIALFSNSSTGTSWVATSATALAGSWVTQSLPFFARKLAASSRTVIVYGGGTNTPWAIKTDESFVATASVSSTGGVYGAHYADDLFVATGALEYLPSQPGVWLWQELPVVYVEGDVSTNLNFVDAFRAIQDQAAVFVVLGALTTGASGTILREDRMFDSATASAVFEVIRYATVSVQSTAGVKTTVTASADAIARLFSTVQGAFVQQSSDAAFALVLNVEGAGTTRYENFYFNSFAKVGDAYYGCKSDGVYMLDGASDAGDPIRSMVSFGKQNFDTSLRKRISNAYVGVSGQGRLFLKVLAEGEEYVYAARSYDENLKVQRFDTGKGLSVNWLEFELYNADGEDFELTSVEFAVVPTWRRI